jgi:hypothetical protein
MKQRHSIFELRTIIGIDTYFDGNSTLGFGGKSEPKTVRRLYGRYSWPNDVILKAPYEADEHFGFVCAIRVANVVAEAKFVGECFTASRQHAVQDHG